MKLLFNATKKFFDKHFALFLILITFISYGQMLGMYVWQDDNALFFKLLHIEESAGYFGPGIIGTDITKYSVAPFYPIYLLFGLNSVFYFAFLLLLYTAVTLIVYKTFCSVLGEVGGRVASFIFAAGYIASDGVWRMANSATTSFSLIFTCLTFLTYWKYYKSKNLSWYVLSILFFFLALEIAVVRAHYLIVIVLAFEIIFLMFQRLPFSLVSSIIRIIPFVYIFNNWVLGASSSRAGQLKEFLFAFADGNFSKYYGFLSSIANLVVPDWLTKYLIFIQNQIDVILDTHLPFLRLILLFLPVAVIFLLLKDNQHKKLLIPISISILTVWSLISKEILIPMNIKVSLDQYFISALGGSIIIIFIILFWILNKHRWLFILLLLWMLGNLAIYSAYNPEFQYGTVERYVAHSFLPLSGLFGLLFISLPKNKKLSRIGKVIIIVVGVGNIITSVIYQNNILQTRSIPARDFYVQLKDLLPVVKKGDVLYFDVADNTQRYYNDAVATAMMPETTAFAWRYGIDRYDIKLVTDFQDLLKVIRTDNVPIENIHTFWYSRSGLQDTTLYVAKILQGKGGLQETIINLPKSSATRLSKGVVGTVWEQSEIEINLSEPIQTSTPVEVMLGLTADFNIQDELYPLTWKDANLTEEQRLFFNAPEMSSLSLEYKQSKEILGKNSRYSVSSDWQNNVVKNLHDGDLTSIWQSERTGWGREFTFISMQLPSTRMIEKAVWINGSAHNTPIKYNIDVSIDGINWKTVKEVYIPQRIETREPQAVSFDPVSARFVRMVLFETLNGDSPSVAEFWVVPTGFSKLNISLAEQFLAKPFALLSDEKALQNTLRANGQKGKVQLMWQGDKSRGWQTTKQSEIDIHYDGQKRLYKINIPAGGSKITKLKLSNFTIPGEITWESLDIRYPGIKELINN